MIRISIETEFQNFESHLKSLSPRLKKKFKVYLPEIQVFSDSLLEEKNFILVFKKSIHDLSNFDEKAKKKVQLTETIEKFNSNLDNPDYQIDYNQFDETADIINSFLKNPYDYIGNNEATILIYKSSVALDSKLGDLLKIIDEIVKSASYIKKSIIGI